LEEEEWEANAGISGGRGRPQWNVGVSHKWDEEGEKREHKRHNQHRVLHKFTKKQVQK
jgi:hypothetical protein